MANNRRCPNGHEYDADMYGNKCPFCPPSGSYESGNKTQILEGAPQMGQAYPPFGGTARTQVISGAGAGFKTQVVGGAPAVDGGTAETRVMGGASEGRTVIHHANAAENTPAHTRRVVGVLVTYDHNPVGDLHRVNEGVNTVGRAGTNAIPVPRDSEMSSHHFDITFRPVDNAYFIRDEESVNGTFVNDELLTLNTSRLLNNYDVIKAGKTTFIFLAIPKIDK